MSTERKSKVGFFELASKLPVLTKDFSKFVRALVFNYTIYPETAVAMGDLLVEAAHKYPDNPCVIYQDKSWSYIEFNNWTNRLAHQFEQMGIQQGDVVALWIENRPEILAISMALAKIGGITALINTAQRNKPLLHSFYLSKAKLVLVGEELIDVFEQIQTDDFFWDKSVFCIEHDDIMRSQNHKIPYFYRLGEYCSHHEAKPTRAICAKDPSMYIYTSGTTGLPKASVISHGRWVKGYAAFGLTTLRLLPEDKLYVPLPFYHATAMVVCWSSVIAGGAALILKKKFSVREFWSDIQKYQATAFAYVGEMCKYLLNSPIDENEKNTTLKKMIGNGLRPTLWADFKQRFGIEQIAEFYASSEGNIAFFNVFNVDETMGFSITNYALVEYDRDKDEPIKNKKGFLIKVETGGTGLLLGEITKRYPYDGYTEDTKTEKTILRNVFKHGDAWFNTNDLVKDMGYQHVQFVDRLGDTFRWKGENVSTQEVEGIINTYSGVLESTVYGVEIPGEGGKAGMAKINMDNQTKSEFDFQKLYKYLSTELPMYAIPIFLRIGNNVSITETFKHQKQALKQEGYNPEGIDDVLYVLLDKKYTPLNKKIYDQITLGKFRF